MPKSKKKEIEWTFTVEELRHYQHAPAKCPCDGCRRINEFYHTTPDFIEWEDKLEKKLAEWKLPKEVKKLDRDPDRDTEKCRDNGRNKHRSKSTPKTKVQD